MTREDAEVGGRRWRRGRRPAPPASSTARRVTAGEDRGRRSSPAVPPRRVLGDVEGELDAALPAVHDQRGADADAPGPSTSSRGRGEEQAGAEHEVAHGEACAPRAATGRGRPAASLTAKAAAQSTHGRFRAVGAPGSGRTTMTNSATATAATVAVSSMIRWGGPSRNVRRPWQGHCSSSSSPPQDQSRQDQVEPDQPTPDQPTPDQRRSRTSVDAGPGRRRTSRRRTSRRRTRSCRTSRCRTSRRRTSSTPDQRHAGPADAGPASMPFQLVPVLDAGGHGPRR